MNAFLFDAMRRPASTMHRIFDASPTLTHYSYRKTNTCFSDRQYIGLTRVRFYLGVNIVFFRATGKKVAGMQRKFAIKLGLGKTRLRLSAKWKW